MTDPLERAAPDWREPLVSAARILSALLLGFAAGLYSGAYLFGDALAGESLSLLTAKLGAGHAVAGLVLGVVAGRFWPVALIACWGSVLVGCLYLSDGIFDLGLLSLLLTLVLAGSARAGAALTRKGAPAEADAPLHRS